MQKDGFDDDVRIAFEMLDSVPLRLGGRGGTAQLANEDDEDGLVIVKNEAGNPVLHMSRHDYDAVKAWKPDR